MLGDQTCEIDTKGVTMYRCHWCKRTFDEPYIIEEDPSPRGIALPQGTERYAVCPYCGDDYIEEYDEDEYEEEEDE